MLTIPHCTVTYSLHWKTHTANYTAVGSETRTHVFGCTILNEHLLHRPSIHPFHFAHAAVHHMHAAKLGEHGPLSWAGKLS
jgi:hypothetical protein